MRHLALLFLCITLISCDKDDDSPNSMALDFVTGKNSYRLDINSTQRNFHVFVPTAYDANTPTPLVFMFHGSGGNGNATYDNSGWRQVAEQNNFICVFPTALEYFIPEINGTQTKWSSAGLSTELEEGTSVEDDIPFVTEMLEQLIATFNIDESRIYASGFSNGGGFTKSRIMCELSDRFAAVATAGGHALPQIVPVQSNDLLPLYAIMGTKDDKKLRAAGQTAPFPMDAALIMEHSYLRTGIDNILEMIQVDTVYSAQPEMPYYNTLYFSDALTANGNEYRFRLIKDMGHIWPTGNNHPSGLAAAELFWPFFQEYSK